MPILTGRIEDRRIRIRVGIRHFEPLGSPWGLSSAGTIDYREYTALVDTGARRTCVSQNVIQALAMRRVGQIDVWNIRRSERHWTYLFNVAIWPDPIDGTPFAPYGIGDEIEGIDVGDNRFFDVLLGMDIISRARFVLETNGSFSFEF